MSGLVSDRIRRAVIALIAMGAAVASPGYARPSNVPIVVQPDELPALARQPGEAMLLHDTPDGRTLLYVEQGEGARLAILEVTDPGRIRSDGSVQLDAIGPFDFVSGIGGDTELIRFRGQQQDGMLDLHRAKVPTLRTLEGLTLLSPVSPAGYGRFAVSADNVKNIREELTKQDTGTTFILTDEGLYVIRNPAAESEKRLRDQEWVNEHSGAG